MNMKLRIRDMREDNDLTQQKIADILLCDQSLYSKYERGERERFEVYYKKYATNFPYNIRRFFEDQKFKRKRKKAAKNKPKPVWNPPNRTAEETKAIQVQMKKLYKEYHVSVRERIKRKWKALTSKQQDETVQS